MDILYILGTGSKHDNIELRMSLRSIAKYGRGIGRVIVAGYPCDWLSDGVVKVHVPNKYGRKHLNLVYCIQQVVDMGLLKGEFLYSSDDHFYTRHTDFANYPYYVKNFELRNRAVKGERCYGYHVSLVQTRALLEKHGFPILNFEQHCNTHMHAQVVRDFRDLINESYTLERGAAPTSLIMNVWLTQEYGPRTLDLRNDLKIREATNMDDMIQQIGGRECFSVGDSLFSSNVLTDYFKYKYPEKCKYEK